MTIWQSVTNRAVQSGTTNSVTGNMFLPKTAEVFSYDADGNLTNDGRWAYLWDGENRLVRQFAPTTGPSGSVKALTYGYDWQGRRISKTVSNFSGSAWSKVLDERFLSEGWNQTTSLNASNNAVVRAFLWGTDLSGSMQGAGGVGGLLAVDAKGVSVAFAAYDGNGNVTALVNAADGGAIASYEYGPFGELIRASGTAAKTNPFRFSTKFQDDETDLLYYGYRYYDSSKGRWLNRDPIGERGGVNLCVFVQGNPANLIDLLGLSPPVYSDGPLPNPVLPPLWGPPGGPISSQPVVPYPWPAPIPIPPTPGGPFNPIPPIAVDGIEKLDLYGLINSGEKVCEAKAKGSLNTCRCCVIPICKQQGIVSGRMYYKSNGTAYLADFTCPRARELREDPRGIRAGCGEGWQDGTRYEDW